MKAPPQVLCLLFLTPAALRSRLASAARGSAWAAMQNLAGLFARQERAGRHRLKKKCLLLLHKGKLSGMMARADLISLPVWGHP